MSDVTRIATDVLVLGAGPGGYTAAFRSADLGRRTVLVERDPTLGGVCLNVGCIPSKALLHVARVVAEGEELRAHGIDLGGTRPTAAAARAYASRIVAKLTQGLRSLARARKVEVLHGTGRFTSRHELAVEGAEVTTLVHFEQAIIAAGSEAIHLPGLPQDARIWDSTAALELRAIPERLLVVGGGIIGLELATVYDALGARVTVVEREAGLMPGCDRALVRPLEQRIRRRYAAIHTSTAVRSVALRGAALSVGLEGQGAPPEAEFDALLVAVGRRPNGNAIGAEAAGVGVDARGFITVDDAMRTNQPHIFAIGDIAGPPMLAHKAMHEGKVAAEVAAGLKRGFDGRRVPSVAYTDPEIAWVGLTETEARARGIAIGTGVFPWAASGRSLAMGRDEGLTRVLFDPETHRVLGVGIVGQNAGDLIAEGTLAIEMGADAADLGLTIHAHPTLSETLGLAAEVFEGTVTDLHLPGR